MQTFDLSSTKTSQAVFDILTKEFGSLPTYGVIAGQAVASAILRHFKLGAGPMNDLDVFIDVEHEATKGKPSYPFNIPSTYYFDGNSNVIGMYENSMHYIVGVSRKVLGFRVLNTYLIAENNRINHIECHHEKLYGVNCNGLSQSEKIQSIIRGFDINSCMVAFDPAKKEITYLPDFLNFLHSLRLSITNFNTPAQSILRLLKKADEMSAFAKCDTDYEIKRAQYALALMTTYENEYQNDQHNTSYNVIDISLARKYKELLREHFTITHFKPEGDKITGFNMNALFDRAIDSFISPVKKFVFTSAYDLPQDRYTLRTDVSSIFPDYYHIFQSKKNSKGLSKFCGALESSECHISKAIFIKAVFCRNFSFKNISENDIKNAIKIYSKHCDLFLSTRNLSLIEFIKYGRFFTYCEKNKMEYRLGWYEENAGIFENPSNYNFGGNGLSLDDFPDINDPLFKDKVNVSHLAYVKRLKTQVVSSSLATIISSINNDKVHLKELTSGYDLYLEGIEMSHCVGGYFRSLVDGDFIISINCDSTNKDKTKRSTLHISLPAIYVNKEGYLPDLTEKEMVRIYQHRAYANGEPCAENEEIVKILTKKISQQRLAFLLGNKLPFARDVINSIKCPYLSTGYATPF